MCKFYHIYRTLWKNLVEHWFSRASLYLYVLHLSPYKLLPCQYVSALNFVDTSPTLNIYLCCRRPVPNIPPRIPDRPYSGRLNWARATAVARQPRSTQDTSLTAWGKVLFGWPMTGLDEPETVGWKLAGEIYISAMETRNSPITNISSYVILWSQRPQHRVIDVCRQDEEEAESKKDRSCREKGRTRLCYKNTGGERWTKKWIEHKSTLSSAVYRLIRTAREIPITSVITSLITSFSDVYTWSLLLLFIHG